MLETVENLKVKYELELNGSFDLQTLLKSGELLGEKVDIHLEKLGNNWIVPRSVLDELHSRFEDRGLGISPLQLEF